MLGPNQIIHASDMTNVGTHRPGRHLHHHTINTIITLMFVCACVHIVQFTMYVTYPKFHFLTLFKTDKIDFVCVSVHIPARMIFLSQFEI